MHIYCKRVSHSRSLSDSESITQASRSRHQSARLLRTVEPPWPSTPCNPAFLLTLNLLRERVAISARAHDGWHACRHGGAQGEPWPYSGPSCMCAHAVVRARHESRAHAARPLPLMQHGALREGRPHGRALRPGGLGRSSASDNSRGLRAPVLYTRRVACVASRARRARRAAVGTARVVGTAAAQRRWWVGEVGVDVRDYSSVEPVNGTASMAASAYRGCPWWSTCRSDGTTYWARGPHAITIPSERARGWERVGGRCGRARGGWSRPDASSPAAPRVSGACDLRLGQGRVRTASP